MEYTWTLIFGGLFLIGFFLNLWDNFYRFNPSTKTITLKDIYPDELVKKEIKEEIKESLFVQDILKIIVYVMRLQGGRVFHTNSAFDSTNPAHVPRRPYFCLYADRIVFDIGSDTKPVELNFNQKQTQLIYTRVIPFLYENCTVVHR